MSFACCLPLAPDDDMEMAKLRQAVAVARQHHQQRQVPAACDVRAEHDEVTASSEEIPLFGVENFQPDVTSGYVSVPTDVPQSTHDQRHPANTTDSARSPPMSKYHCGRQCSALAAVEYSMSGTCSLREVQFPSVTSLGSSYIDRRVSALNRKYDDELSVECVEDTSL